MILVLINTHWKYNWSYLTNHWLRIKIDTAFSFLHCTQKKLSIKDFFSRFDQICSFLRIWSHLLQKSLLKNFIFSAVWTEIMKRVTRISTRTNSFQCFLNIPQANFSFWKEETFVAFPMIQIHYTCDQNLDYSVALVSINWLVRE